MGEETRKDMILELVQWIDGKRTQKDSMLFRPMDGFGGEMKRLLIMLIALFLVVWIAVYEYAVSLGFQGLYDFKAIITVTSALLPALAVVIASLALFKPDLEKNEVKVRYERALKLRKKEAESGTTKFLTDNEKLALWSLIEIASKNEPFSLMQLYKADKLGTVFTEEKLLERLCK